MDDLDPKQRLAVEMYTNPLFGQTFGNKQASAVAAGYKGKNASEALNTQVAQRAIQWIEEKRDESGTAVADYMSRYAFDAARKLIKQIGMDDGLEIKPMPEGLLDKPATPIVGVDKNGNEKVLGYDDGHLKQAKAISDHNKAVGNVMREVRQALQMVLAYHLGTPEQKVRVAREREQDDPLDLGKMTAAELRELSHAVRQTISLKDGDPPPEKEDGSVVAAVEGVDYEVEEATSPAPAAAPAKADPPASRGKRGGRGHREKKLPF